MKSETFGRLEALAERKIVVIDGAFGTMVQALGLTEADFRGTEFAAHAGALAGCNDLLSLTQPAVVADIHRQYLCAGADIIETNSFNSNAISLAEYGLSDRAADIARAAARVARSAADAYTAESGREVFVAGSIGPTSKSLTMAVTLGDDITFAEMAAAYRVQVDALLDGGVDLLVIETIFDTLNAKAAILAAREAFEARGTEVPVILSATLTESGRTLSGQTLEAFVASTEHAGAWAVGLNCGFGIEAMEPHLRVLQGLVGRVSAYANAGLPDRLGRYTETPEMMADAARRLLDKGMLSVVGGCCGTTPDYIRALAVLAGRRPAPARAVPPQRLRLAGLETLDVTPDTGFINVGERCNVAGSRKFLRLIGSGAFDEALEVARTQVEQGARIIDVNMDDGMLDAPAAMRRFVSLSQVDPVVAAVPLMIDSSDRAVLLAGLQCVQGKPVVNSISLKEGEEAFVANARMLRRYGAAMVVMAFDERGQATDLERKIEICGRSYRLLTERAGVPPTDIILDPNVLAVATGMAEHSRYALDYIEAVRWIKANLPGAKVSGGLSNLSFSFRGNNTVREAMHSLLLSHTIPMGQDMAIVNAAALPPADTIDPALARAVDDVLLDRDPHAADRLVDIASAIAEAKAAEKEQGAAAPAAAAPEAPGDACASLSRAVGSGSPASVVGPLADAALEQTGSALAVINGPLMEAMDSVGVRFAAGRVFLPQVVKAASAMKAAVDRLTPAIEAERGAGAGDAVRPRVLLATVKGDVHDIGKNIVGVILRCNGYDVVDLGVMVPPERILDEARARRADAVGLSGLITPSLEEMRTVARMMEEAGMEIPLFVGGATTSALHTAARIAPLYSSGAVVHTRDAAQLPGRIREFADPATRADATAALRADQEQLRSRAAAPGPAMLPIAEARAAATAVDAPAAEGVTAGTFDYRFSIAELRPLINWRAYLTAWRLDASLADVAAVGGCDHCRAQWLAALPQPKRGKGAEAMQLIKDANRALDCLAGQGYAVEARLVVCGASRRGDDIILEAAGAGGADIVVPTLRRQCDPADPVALADFVAPAGDVAGIFAVTVGRDIDAAVARKMEVDSEYLGLVYATVASRLAEAATEALHRRAMLRIHGSEEIVGIRPAVGYPSLPDQSLVHILDAALRYRDLGITPTDSGALHPSATTTGLILPNRSARYFALGPVGYDQRRDYITRHPLKRPDLEKFLQRN